MSFEWAHIIIASLSALAGGVSGLVAGVWRIARFEGRLTASFQKSINDCERRFEDKVEHITGTFDETLKGLRQKINDVELETERGFVAKGDFDDFRKEYREDMRDLKSSIAGISKAKP